MTMQRSPLILVEDPRTGTMEARAMPESSAVIVHKTTAVGKTELLPSTSIQFTVKGEPFAKPRMTRRDKWMQRRCVLLYRAWADQIRAAADRSGPWPQALEGRIHVRFWLSFPKTYRPRRRVGLIGAPHRSSPDADNLLKGIADALFEADGFLWHQTVEKYWDDGQGPRAEIELR